MDKNHSNLINRHNMVGGQAVIEGVMMKKGDRVALAVRKEDGSVETKTSEFKSPRKKLRILNKPIIRGIVAFFESLALSFRTLSQSTEMLDLEEDKKKTDKKKGSFSTFLIMTISVILGLLLAVLLFTVVPMYVTDFLVNTIKLDPNARGHFIIIALCEGVIKIAIFIAYLLAVSLMKDIRRTFEYHGAEHKAIACFESGHELTVANARKCTRFHPRCGTSFLFVMLILSILASAFIPLEAGLGRTVVKLLLLPIIMGIGYEYIMYAGKNENTITRILSAPGLWMQRITTREPSDDQLQVAICAIKTAVPELYPRFDTSDCTISLEKNRDHIGNVGKKIMREKPIYQVPKTKLDLYFKSAECNEVKVPAETSSGKTVTFSVKKYR
ncbi:MAG: DUF1385 domain-containing protein [Ruminococcaceae bacterium]|nr:DUF1385 domain-containing protein [Oscillospiraceae bacterium]